MENTLQELGTFVTIVAIVTGIIGVFVVGAIATAITLLVKKIKSPDTNTKGARPYRSGNKSSTVRFCPRQAYRARQRKIRRRTFKRHQQTRRTRTTA